MKSLKFLAFSLAFVFALTSCNKEDMTEVIDKTPEVTPEEVTENNVVALNALVFTIDDAVISKDYDTNGDLAGYSVSLGSAGVNAGGALFVSGWDALDGETSLQEIDYVSEGSITLSQAGLDALNLWIANGEDPNDAPDISDEGIFYFSSDLTISVSNVSSTSADLVLDGSIVDMDGNVVVISASFTATIE